MLPRTKKDAVMASGKDSQNQSAFTSFQLVLLSLMVAQNSAVVLLGRYSQTAVENPEDKFSNKNLVATTEAVKFLVCLVLIGLENLSERYPPPLNEGFIPKMPLSQLMASLPGATIAELSKIVANPINSLIVSPPAALYLLQNNILYVALSNLTAPVFQVCYQTKLVTTAVVSVVLMNRRYARVQWISLVALGVGVSVVVLGEQGIKEEVNEDNNQNLFLGLIAVAMATLSSAFAGVYFEKVVKGAGKSNTKPTSLWVRNVELAFFSILFSTIFSLLSGSVETTDTVQKPFFHGFTTVTWMLVFLQAGGGLLVAAIVKYADNVVKGLATGVAVVVSTLTSVMLLGMQLRLSFIVGGGMILTSVWAFSNHTKVPGLLGLS